MKSRFLALVLGLCGLVSWAVGSSTVALSEPAKLLLAVASNDQYALKPTNPIQLRVLEAWRRAIAAPIIPGRAPAFALVPQSDVPAPLQRRLTMPLSSPSILDAVKRSGLEVDGVISTTVYARAVQGRNGSESLLQLRLLTEVFDAASGRRLANDDRGTGRERIVMPPCQDAAGNADPECIQQFVSARAVKLSEEAARQIALTLTALLAR